MINNVNPDLIDMLADTIAEAIAERFAKNFTAPIIPVPEIMDTAQAAAYMGISTQQLEIARCKGGGPPFSKWGRLVKYRRTAIDDFLLANEHKNTVKPKFGYRS
jgi:hypothetical protein